MQITSILKLQALHMHECWCSNATCTQLQFNYSPALLSCHFGGSVKVKGLGGFFSGCVPVELDF